MTASSGLKDSHGYGNFSSSPSKMARMGCDVSASNSLCAGCRVNVRQARSARSGPGFYPRQRTPFAPIATTGQPLALLRDGAHGDRFTLLCNWHRVDLPSGQQLFQLKIANTVGQVAHEPAVKALRIGAVRVVIVLNGARNALRARLEMQHMNPLPFHSDWPLAFCGRSIDPVTLRDYCDRVNPLITVRCGQSSGGAITPV